MNKPIIETISKDFIHISVNGRLFGFLPKEFKTGLDRVYCWQYSSDDSFGSRLCSLIAKADDENLLKLCEAFPETVIAYLLWYWKDTSDKEFFEKMEEMYKMMR